MERIPINKRQILAPDLESHSKIVCSAVQQARQALQPSLREQVRKLRLQLEESRQSGKDPLSVFPQEIWATIFRPVEDVNDLANIAQTCSLFGVIINSSRQELLFGKAIPFVLPYLKMDNSDQNFSEKWLLLCRQICKSWRSGADSFANARFRAPQPILGIVERLEKEQLNYSGKDLDMETHYFFLPLGDDNDDNEENKNEKDDYLKSILGTPFLGEASYCIPGGLSNLSGLDICSHRVGKLNLSKTTHKETISSEQIYVLSVAAIEKCQNLQTFCLEFFSKPTQSPVDNQLEINVPTSLECLEVFQKDDAIVSVQDGLIRRLSPQLKRLKIKVWNSSLYQGLSWKNLREVEILEGASTEVLYSVGNIAAPNMQKLSLLLISDCRDLKVLFRAINHFPILRHLSLIMSDGFDVLEEKDIVNIPLHLLTINGITILELISTKLNTSRILPVLFPAVRNLVLRYGSCAAGGLGIDSISKNAQPSKPEFIKVYKNMYKSNIWTILPQLDCLNLEFTHFEVSRGSSPKANQINDEKIFTRRGYILETEEYFMGYQRHLEKVHCYIRNELKAKLAAEHKKLNKKQVKASVRDQSTCNVGIHTIFLYVLPWLGKSDAFNCRLLSKCFHNMVDEIYLQTIKPDTLDKFHLPLDTNSPQNFYSLIEENKSKPFFGYNTEILLKSSQTAGIDLLLKEIGKNVRHLTISVEPGVVPGIACMYAIVRECMAQCVNMKSFFLNIHHISHNGYDKYSKIYWSRKPKTPKNLEYISTYGPKPKPKLSPLMTAESYPKLNMLITDLKQMCGKTLKTRKQENPSEDEYRKLKDLTITNLCQTEKLCGAPNLEKLHICLTMKESNLEYLWKVTSEYPKLKLLELQFATECLGFTRNIIYTNPHHIIKVTTLKIVVQDKWQINLDFLAHFPYLKMLQITYGKQAPLMNAENKNEDVVARSNILDTEAGIPEQGFHQRQPDQDFIQLVKYMKDEESLKHDKENIYASKIWMVLRRLQKLETVLWTDENTFAKTEFYRKHK